MKNHLPQIRINDYTYSLPNHHIAEFPLPNREDSKLLTFKNGEITDCYFRDLPQLLPSDSMLVLNNTKVIPARLYFIKPSGHTVEIFLLKPLNQSWSQWQVMVGNRRRFSENETLHSAPFWVHGKEADLSVSWINREENQIVITTGSELNLQELILNYGTIPLPPYIKRKTNSEDKARYQTVFGTQLGAVAAPTASLHFSDKVLHELTKKGIPTLYLTLHVGLGTFKPVTAEYTTDHTMHAEDFTIQMDLVAQLLSATDRQVVAAGTTTLRMLESLYYIGAAVLLGNSEPTNVPSDAGFNPQLNQFTTHEALQALLVHIQSEGGSIDGQTAIFILPGFKFRIVQGLITNFHQPQSTLLLLVAAFLGKNWKEIYTHALGHNYRFLSYGDGSLLWQ